MSVEQVFFGDGIIADVDLLYRPDFRGMDNVIEEQMNDINAFIDRQECDRYDLDCEGWSLTFGADGQHGVFVAFAITEFDEPDAIVAYTTDNSMDWSELVDIVVAAIRSF